MQYRFINKLKHAWNAFNHDPTLDYFQSLGPSSTFRPDRVRIDIGTERSIVSSIYSVIGNDVAGIDIRHVRLDENNRYIDTIDSGLNNCLSVEANIDQSPRNFILDVVLSMFDEGSVAIVPVDTSVNPKNVGSFDILSLRTAKIVEWFPKHVKLELYNDRSGIKENIVLPKKSIAIIENPFYLVMNEPNSTLKRLISKLNLLDAIDTQSGSGRLDIIIQLPFVIKTPARREQAEARRLEIENQLAGSKYGIAYIDGTEKITQLNRPAENNLMKQIEFLTSMLYSQLGITQSILDGTANEKTLINYYNRAINPVLSAITDGMYRNFITKTARTQGQSIAYFRDPFSVVPATDFSAIADTLTRNAILTSNEVRGILGLKPSSDKDADTLRNKNLNPENPSSTSTSLKKTKDIEEEEEDNEEGE